MKKFLTVIFSIVTVLSLTLALASCNGGGGSSGGDGGGHDVCPITGPGCN